MIFQMHVNSAKKYPDDWSLFFFNTVHVHKEYQISMVFIWLKCLDAMQYDLKVLVTALYNI